MRRPTYETERCFPQVYSQTLIIILSPVTHNFLKAFWLKLFSLVYFPKEVILLNV